MTDAHGKVLFDSANKAVGQDYSRWNDVWLTLRGQYGARSTLQNPADPESSVMYVAAPIMGGSRLIGVLSVGKPNAAMAPVIKRSERRILWASAILLGIALVIGAGMVWWMATAPLPGSLAMLIPSLTISPFLFPISVVASCVTRAGAGKYAREAGREKLY
ncbi:hypothetical protein ACULNC_21380 [Shigella flexneri]